MLARPRSKTSHFLSHLVRIMTSNNHKTVHFGPFEVTDQVLHPLYIKFQQIKSNTSFQVFYHSSLSYALVNIKPILPGHVLVVPYRQCQRLTDLRPDEVTDLFTTVQKVERMLARSHFTSSDSHPSGKVEDGSYNIAVQDGPDSGQTVAHVHCHIIPRQRNDKEGDRIYDRLQSEEGNVGGGLWDQSRPKLAGKFPKVEEADRKPRSAEEMIKEAAFYREQMMLIENEE